MVEPCFPGYGVTVGNALRRVLLSSLEGAAITAVKVKGVDHEFSAIPFVIEDAVQLILNLKKVRFRLHEEGPFKLNLNFTGEGEVTASHIETNASVEVVNPDHHIATVTGKNASLSLELTIERGYGYMPVEERESENPVGTISIDAIFTPIRAVGYRVENVRVGQQTNYERLLLDIETDGSILAHEALSEASHILIEYFTSIFKAFASGAAYESLLIEGVHTAEAKPLEEVLPEVNEAVNPTQE